MIVAMVVVLMTVMMAIETARVMSTRGAAVSPHWGALLVPFGFAVLTLMCGLGIIGYGLLIALRRIVHQRMRQSLGKRP